MSRICLINPPASFLIDDRVFISLGILYVASALEGEGHQIDFLDLSGADDGFARLEEYLAANPAAIFGITATSPQLPAVYAIVDRIRGHLPKARIILGGAHVSLVHAAYKRERKQGRAGRATINLQKLLDTFDVLVAGNGDKAVLLAIQPDSPRIIDADDVKSPLFINSTEFENLPRPALHYVDFSTYNYTIDGVGATSIIAQLGCPFKCRFCGGRHTSYLRRIRTRSCDNILEEIDSLYRTYGTRAFMFYDDELNVNKSFVELLRGLCKLQDFYGIDMHFRGFVKAELFTREQAELMRQAGFKWILSGFETGSPRMLTNMSKISTIADNLRCLETAKQSGLKIKALMSIGHPGESHESIRQTYEWLAENRPDDFDVTIISAYPGASYYDDAVKHETLEDIWTYTAPETGDRLYCREIDYSRTPQFYKGKPNGGYAAYVHTDALSSDELVQLRDYMESDIRRALSLSMPTAAASVQHDQSMGQFPYSA